MKRVLGALVLLASAVAADVAAWGVYRVALDEHRALQRLAVRAVLPSGEVVDGGPRDRVERSAPSGLRPG